MEESRKADNQRYDVDIVKMIRNNNIATGEDSIKDYDLYFMLDYFDLLFHKRLAGENKIYKDFWNIRDNYKEKGLNYKVAYKTLSLYTKKENALGDIFKIQTGANQDKLSITPFLGVIQINFVHYIYENEPSVEETLSACEQKIIEYLKKNGFEKNKEINYQMFRSSTSGDFCLVVKSAMVEDIFKISTLINNLVIKYKSEEFKFNTYTNIGIECQINDKKQFLSFHEDTIKRNAKCEFALRITTYNGFAQRLYSKLKVTKDMKIVVEPMEGLFGRYDFLIYISMEEFSQIFSTLCKSKIMGKKSEESNPDNDNEISFMRLLEMGIEEGKIKIINERVLVPLSNSSFDLEEIEDTLVSNYSQLADKEKKLKNIVRQVSAELKNSMNRLQKFEGIFIEERRAFIDISRELWEVISTYVPQGMENDSHVNWQILISDLRVIFACVDSWKDAYDKCQDTSTCKEMRVHFLEDLRFATDAINQYYKFLQNVNAQTWQSPLYEIQTQLDAEKMMIAYREFLYEYFHHYQECYKGSKDERPMIYPVVFPDMLNERVFVSVVFLNINKLSSYLLVCKVPSFEYYGRMFDMLPWILHEASHSIRTLEREERNGYLIKLINRRVFEQAIYKLLNQYSNDFGYRNLGGLENDILDVILEAVSNEFIEYCSSKKEDAYQIEMNYLETELIDFLHIIFDNDIHQIIKEEDEKSVQAMQTALLKFLGELNLIGEEVGISEQINTIELVDELPDSADAMSKLLEIIYNSYYMKYTNSMPEENEWKILRQDSNNFEESLEKNFNNLIDLEISGEAKKDYCFNMRELNRLYSAWYKRRRGNRDEQLRNNLWKKCIPEVRSVIKIGFKNNKGFTELYRILNMVFGNGELVDDVEAKRVGEDFNVLLQEEVSELVAREITLYRESCADLYMAGALGLDAFGYCRQMFQTVSDASVENSVKWDEAINVHRFRAVAAVLLSKECIGKEMGRHRQIPMDGLLDRGRKYCHATLECARKTILSRDIEQEKQELIQWFFELLSNNIDEIFSYFKQEDSIEEALEDSLLSMYLNPDVVVESDDADAAYFRKEVRNKYKQIEKELGNCKHVIYRIKCFITILDLIGENGNIIISAEEYGHLTKLYEAHLEKIRDMCHDESCKEVSEFYNVPQSADEKSHEEMLEDTIRFVQNYYYKNRFKIMSSETIKGEVK